MPTAIIMQETYGIRQPVLVTTCRPVYSIPVLRVPPVVRLVESLTGKTQRVVHPDLHGTIDVARRIHQTQLRRITSGRLRPHVDVLFHVDQVHRVRFVHVLVAQTHVIRLAVHRYLFRRARRTSLPGRPGRLPRPRRCPSSANARRRPSDSLSPGIVGAADRDRPAQPLLSGRCRLSRGSVSRTGRPAHRVESESQPPRHRTAIAGPARPSPGAAATAESRPHRPPVRSDVSTIASSILRVSIT